MENLDPPPPPPQIKDGKMARFCPSPAFILDLGGMGFAVPFYFVQDCILGQNKWKTQTPLPLKSRMGKWRVFALRAPSSLIWGGGGWGFAVPFYFVQDCIYQNPKKWPKKSIRKFSKKMFINPNFISKNLEIYSRNPDLSQLHIICIKCWIFVTCTI